MRKLQEVATGLKNFAEDDTANVHVEAGMVVLSTFAAGLLARRAVFFVPPPNFVGVSRVVDTVGRVGKFFLAQWNSKRSNSSAGSRNFERPICRRKI